jgi:SHS2 domain-containing protein
VALYHYSHPCKAAQAEYNILNMGFEEIPHTADWSARVWAPDLPSLFTEAARAMSSLSGTVIGNGPRVTQMFEAEGPDVESLLVAFLSELVYYQEQENLTFDAFDLRVAAQWLKVQMEGAPIASVEKAIKAVTYHNLKIEKTAEGLETTIVFDV